MPKQRVYVETSIPSWYCQTRTDMESVVRQELDAALVGFQAGFLRSVYQSGGSR